MLEENNKRRKIGNSYQQTNDRGNGKGKDMGRRRQQTLETFKPRQERVPGFVSPSTCKEKLARTASTFAKLASGHTLFLLARNAVEGPGGASQAKGALSQRIRSLQVWLPFHQRLYREVLQDQWLHRPRACLLPQLDSSTETSSTSSYQTLVGPPEDNSFKSALAHRIFRSSAGGGKSQQERK